MRRIVPVSILLCGLTLWLGELMPPVPENLRGYFVWSLDERVKTFTMYEESAVEALNRFRHYAARTNMTLPLFPTTRPENSPLLCVGILTARRIGSKKLYLVQLVGSLVARMDIPVPNDVYMHIFNVDAQPESHTEVSRVSDLIPVSNIKRRDGLKVSVKQQEALDYVEAFRSFGQMGCRNSLMLEDDAFASEDWISQIRNAMDQLRKQPDWFIVRLYVPRYYARYPRGIQRLYDYNPGYGTVAILLNGEHMEEFTSALESHIFDSLNGNFQNLPKDTYMTVFGRQNNLPIQSFEPVVFQHTGMHSTVETGRQYTTTFPLYMSARNFVSEGKPVIFQPNR